MINPWDAWMRGENWFPRIEISNHTTPNDRPQRAAYPVHPCPFCYAETSYIAACAACRATKITLLFHHLREEVRNGLRSDWPLLPHVQHQIDHTRRAATIPAQTFFAAVIARAEAHGFTLDGTIGAPEPPLFYYYPDDEEYTS